MTPRKLDHLVLPTAGLAIARERLSRMGFVVAPEGVHPFGTNNACVYLSDGTFIELLAAGDATLMAQAAASGNSFVLGDQRFRASQGDEGFSAIVVGTQDADADHEDFSRRGIGGGAMVQFSRAVIDLAGRTDIATFRLAFAAHDKAPDLFFFTCESRRAPEVDRSALQRHANGVGAVRAIIAVAQDPAGFADFLGQFASAKVEPVADGVHATFANCSVRIVSGQERGVRLTGIVFGVSDLGAAATLLDEAAIDHVALSSTLRVPAAAGQGADFIFEEVT